MKKTINIDFDNSSSIVLGYQPDMLSTAATGYAIGSHTHGNVSGINITCISSASNGLTLSVADPGIAVNSAYVTGPYLLGSTLGVSTSIGISGVQPAGAYITTAALSDHSHGGFAAASGMIAGTISINSWSLSIPDFILTQNATAHTHPYAGTGATTATTSSNQIKATLNANGLDIRVPNYLTTAAASNHTHGTFLGTNLTLISSGSAGLAISGPDKIGTVTSINTVTGSAFLMTGNTAGITISVPNFLTTALAGSHSHGNVSTVSTSGSDLTYTSASSGLTLGIPAWITTAGNADHTHGNISLSLDGLSGTYSSASSGLTFSLTNSTHSHPFAGTSTAATNVGLTVNTDGIRVSLDTAGLTSFGDGVNIIAVPGTSASSNETVIFSNSNGIGFGLNAGTLTASYSQSTHEHSTLDFAASDHSHSQYLTTAMVSNAGSNFIGTMHAGTNVDWTVSSDGISFDGARYLATSNALYIGIDTEGNTTGNTGYIYFSSLALVGGDNITLSGIDFGGNKTIKIIGASGGGGTGGIAIQDSATTFDTGTVIFSNANGISFGLSSNTMTASYNTGAYIGTAYLNYYQATADNSLSAYRTHTHGSISTSLIAGSILQNTSSSSGITLGIPAWLTTAAAVSHSHGSISTLANTTGTNIQNTSASSGLTLAIPPYAVTSHTHSNLYAGIGHTHGSISLATSNMQGASASSASNGLTLSISGYPATSFVQISQIGDIVFADSLNANATWTASTGTGASSRTTYVGILAGGGTGAAGITAYELEGANTAGTTSQSLSNRLYLSGGNNITLSGNANTIIVSAGTIGGVGSFVLGGNTAGSTTASGSVIQLVGGSNVTLSAYGGSNIRLDVGDAGSMYFSDGSGISFGISSDTANNTTITGSVATGSVYFASDSGNITWSSTNTGNSTFIYGSAPAAGTAAGGSFSAGMSTFGNTAGTAGTVSNRLILVGGSNITLSQSTNSVGATVTFIGASGGTAVGSFTAGVSNLGNTGGTTGVVSNRVVFVGSNNITLSQSSNASGATVSIFGGASGSITADALGTNTSIAGGLMTGNTSGLTLNIPVGSIYFSDGSGITFGSATSGSSTTITASFHEFGNIYFSDGSGITFGVSSNASSHSTVTGSIAAIQISGSNTSLEGNTITFGNLNGLSHYISNGSLVGSYSQSTHDHPYAASTHIHGNISFGTRTGTAYTYSSASNGLTISAPNALTTAAASNHTHGNISLALSNLTGTYSSASNGLTLSLTNTYGGGGGLAGLGNTATIPFTSGSVMLSGVNLTVNTSSTGASQYMQISGPSIGYLYFSNTNGHSWSSSTSGVSTSIYLVTA